MAIEHARDEAATTGAPLLVDEFTDDRAPGRVVGVGGHGRIRRGGRDVEGAIGSDGGAARIRPLIEPGWGRSVLAYGPFERRAGLAVAVHLANGHNGSENTDRWPSLPRWLLQWARGMQNEPVPAHLLRWRGRPGRESLRHRLAVRSGAERAHDRGRALDENLAVGWLGSEAPTDALGGGNGFVVRATGGDNAVLGVAVGDARIPAVRSLQNVPLHHVVVLRDRGAIHYVASLPRVAGTVAPPRLRPVGISDVGDAATVWAGVHQSVLGQVGWGVDTRVRDVRAADVAELAQWYTSAHLADRRPAADGSGEVGPAWRAGHDGWLVADPGRPSGLVHARVHGAGGLGWRVRGTDGWFLHLQHGRAELEVRAGGEVVDRHESALAPTGDRAVQVLDDGDRVLVCVDGRPIFDGDLRGPAGEDTGTHATGLAVIHASGVVHDLEAHPREIETPAALAQQDDVDPTGGVVVLDERFDLEPGPLDDRPAADGTRTWQRTLGRLPYHVDGHGGVVVPQPPPPRSSPTAKLDTVLRATGNRIAYTVPWEHPASADVEITVRPPGTARGEGAKGRAGVVFWQDEANFVTVSTWLDDDYDGTSVSSFFVVDGYEEVYDAVWTNVGRRIAWGNEYRLRVAFDGNWWQALVGDEPVLHRALSDVYPGVGRFTINRVGICNNWEYGDDTGSRFVRVLLRTAG
ncbi:MAG: nucleotide-binding protein [Actinomycetota bacterium]|nr:nucleotide-binding protein [Actinomycetota bacterium]